MKKVRAYKESKDHSEFVGYLEFLPPMPKYVIVGTYLFELREATGIIRNDCYVYRGNTVKGTLKK